MDTNLVNAKEAWSTPGCSLWTLWLQNEMFFLGSSNPSRLRRGTGYQEAEAAKSTGMLDFHIAIQKKSPLTFFGDGCFSLLDFPLAAELMLTPGSNIFACKKILWNWAIQSISYFILNSIQGT